MIQLKSVVGLGTDIVDVGRFWKIVGRESNQPSSILNRFAKKILNLEHEYPKYSELCGEPKNGHAKFVENKKKIVYYLAGCWAVKEAAFKSLDNRQQAGFKQFNKWYKIYDTTTGRPIFWHDYGENKSLFADNEFLVSISHDNNWLVATVIRQRCINLAK